MNRTALYALILALGIPLACYFVVKKVSDNAVVMPSHYYSDSIATYVDHAKMKTDTIWHQLQDRVLTNQLGEQVHLQDLKGKVVVANFFFTRCPTICPPLTLRMKHMVDGIHNAQRVGDKTPDFLRIISFSIDPERDSVKQLKQWADRFQIDPQQWWLVTGNKKDIYDMALNEIKLGLVDGEGIDTNFIHTDHFVLLDTALQVRGYYHGLDSQDVNRLARDIIFLSQEKDPKRKGFLSGKLLLIATVFLTTLLFVFILLYFLKKKRNYA